MTVRDEGGGLEGKGEGKGEKIWGESGRGREKRQRGEMNLSPWAEPWALKFS